MGSIATKRSIQKTEPVLKVIVKIKLMKKQQDGFSYIDTLIAIVILTIGILGSLSALTYAVFYRYAAESKTQAKEITQSTIESIFAVRDFTDKETIKSWETIQVKEGTNKGIFLKDWTPVRDNPGADGIYGTADDACPATGNCTVNGVTNTGVVIQNFSRKIEITDITESNAVLKRRIVVTVRYPVGRLFFEERAATIIANLPFN